MSIAGVRWLTLLISAGACGGPTLDLGGTIARDGAIANDGALAPEAGVNDATAPADGSCADDEDCPLETRSRCLLSLSRCVACLTDDDCDGARCELGEWHCESH